MGYFVPPVDGNYTFYVRGDDYVAMFLSTDSSPANLTRIAYNPGAENLYQGYQSFFVYPPNWYGFGAVSALLGQISKPIPLVGGTPYFTRVLHSQINGPTWFDTAVRISTNDPIVASEPQRRLRSTPTVQLLQIQTAIVREVQVITLTGVDSATWCPNSPYRCNTASLLTESSTAGEVQSMMYGVVSLT